MHYQLRWHDVGYAEQDIVEWHPKDYCLKFTGLVESYEAVSVHPLPAALTMYVCVCHILAFWSIQI